MLFKGLFVAILLLTASCNKDSSSSGPMSTSQTSTNESTGSGEVTADTWNEEFLDLINAHRSSIGLQKLLDEESISQIALTHSQNMANKTVPFGHDGFSTRCAEAREALHGGNACGENVAYGQKSPLSVFNAWMGSTGHRANIENARYTHSGFGYKKNANGTIYWTHLFLEKR